MSNRRTTFAGIAAIVVAFFACGGKVGEEGAGAAHDGSAASAPSEDSGGSTGSRESSGSAKGSSSGSSSGSSGSSGGSASGNLLGSGGGPVTSTSGSGSSAAQGDGATPACMSTAGGGSSGVGTCSLYDQEVCGPVGYQIECHCPEAVCTCTCCGTTVHQVALSTCPACPTAAQAYELCGFP